MNLDLIGVVEENIKIKQKHEILNFYYDSYEKFNGWLVYYEDKIDDCYINLMYSYNDIQKIILVIQFYKEKVFIDFNYNNWYYTSYFDQTYYMIFGNIEIVKFCIELFGDKLLNLPMIGQFIRASYYKKSCIELLKETYGTQKLQALNYQFN